MFLNFHKKNIKHVFRLWFYAGVFGVGGSNSAISGSIISKMAADGHLGMTALSRVTLTSAGLSC